MNQAKMNSLEDQLKLLELQKVAVKAHALDVQMERLKIQDYKPHKCEPKTEEEAFTLATDNRM